MGVELKPRYIGPSKGTLIALFCAATGGLVIGSALNERGHDAAANTVSLTEAAPGQCTNGKITMRQDASGVITMTLPAGCTRK